MMTDELTLEELNRQLGEVQDHLLALQPTDFAAKHRLKTEQDRLRNLAGKYHRDHDEERPSDDLLAELRAREASLDEFRKKMPGAAKAASAGGEVGAWNGPGNIMKINEAMKSAHGIDAQVQRIARLETILKARGEL